ncbi:hypothetical protein AbraIFM66950_008672 [Aspergillus brasiliensis]|nr:hypothetical protein AbraIFM66950_008672 [Aspergillus brasiliensis]
MPSHRRAHAQQGHLVRLAGIGYTRLVVPDPDPWLDWLDCEALREFASLALSHPSFTRISLILADPWTVPSRVSPPRCSSNHRPPRRNVSDQQRPDMIGWLRWTVMAPSPLGTLAEHVVSSRVNGLLRLMAAGLS